MKKSGFIIAVIVLVLIAIPTVFGLLGDFWWFEALGFGSVFTTILSTDVLMWVGLFLVSFVIFIVNIKFSVKKKKQFYLFILFGLFFSVILSSIFTNWNLLLRFENASLFNQVDPIFGNDIGFYVFKLPFINHMLFFGMSLVIMNIVLVSGSHLSNFIGSVKSKSGFLYTNESGDEKSLNVDWEGLWKKASTHLTILVSVFLVLLGIFIWLSRYDLLFSASGVVFGASYVGVNVWLPVLTISSILTIISGLVFGLNKFIGLKKSLIPVALVLLVVLIGGAFTVVSQAITVGPDEFNVEKPYIERNINYTLSGYGMEDFKTRDFVTEDISFEEANNSKTIKNARLWDWRPLKRTYEQTQLFRTYYNFNDVDTDRYDDKQYDISARELNFEEISPESRTWVNKHLVYTHGFGLAMSPVSEVRNGGFPVLSVKDIPPKSEKFSVNQSRIYYGELADQFIVTNTTTREFDYPLGNENKYTVYGGRGGLQLDGLKRLVYSFTQGSFELLVSSSVKDYSKILLHRNIKNRLKKVAPFLKYDEDPYLVAENGRLYWIADAYTVTDKYPYSRPSGDINYVRNSVKAVVDAYNGNVDLYVVEEEPLVETYEKIFPDLFKDFEEMPENLKKHIRYPEGLFDIQSRMYALYHMKDPQVFYNKEDEWKIPREFFRGREREMTPYYVLLEVENETQFSLVMPFTPAGKDNMIAWMAGLSDGDRYGEMLVYEFSKQELEYGPRQVENRIDQNTEISRLFSLWDQHGSNVIRGNLLALPVKDAIVYVEPIFLQASSGGLPQLKRVIVSYKDNLAMGHDLMSALEGAFEGQVLVEEFNESQVVEEADENQIAEEFNESLELEDGDDVPDNSVEKANELYEKAQNALQEGDFSQYADYIEQLGEVLQELKE